MRMFSLWDREFISSECMFLKADILNVYFQRIYFKNCHANLKKGDIKNAVC